MSTELARSDNFWTGSLIEVAAKRIAEAKMNGLDESKAFCVLLRARADGVDPILAIDMYHVIPVTQWDPVKREEIISGQRVTISAQEARARFLKAGGKLSFLNLFDNLTQIMDVEWQGKKERITTTLQYFIDCGIAVNHKGELKKNWRSFGPEMQRARMSMTYIRATCPQVLNGLYAHEEFDIVDAQSTSVVVTPTAPTVVSSTLELYPKPAPRAEPAAPELPPKPSREAYKSTLDAVNNDPGPQSIADARAMIAVFRARNDAPKAVETLENAIAAALNADLDNDANEALADSEAGQ